MRSWSTWSTLRSLPAWGLLLCASLLAPTPARAEPTDARWRSLLAGEVVREPHTIDHGSRRFVGGVTYALTSVSPEEVAALADDVGQYASFLPYTHRARLLGENNGDRFVEFVSGNRLVNVRYTLRFRRTAGNTLRFWLDPSKPHDVPDAWGYLRWQPVQTAQGPRVLMTMGVLAELPDDLTRTLFQSRVQNALLSVLHKLTGGLDDARLARGGRP